MRTEESCTFCRIVYGSDPAYVVYEDAHSIAFLDRQPAAEGHTLVVPREHARTLLDIDPLNAGALMTSATFVARIIHRAIQPDGMTLKQTNEHAGGQSVFHVHLHLVPRWNGDNVIAPWNAQRADANELALIQSRLLTAVNGN
ncbi:MAG TPA: HIT family protein [Acidimicrobiales bacterium]|nr:HIT family protein [Acidimicrobiales bacterium]